MLFLKVKEEYKEIAKKMGLEKKESQGRTFREIDKWNIYVCKKAVVTIWNLYFIYFP